LEQRLLKAGDREIIVDFSTVWGNQCRLEYNSSLRTTARSGVPAPCRETTAVCGRDSDMSREMMSVQF
jgi:hypothetical protein